MPTDNEFDDNENEDKWFLMFCVYAIISLQFLLAVAVGSVVVSVSRIPHFVLHTAPGLSIYIISIVLCLIIQCVLLDLRNRWPCNCVLFILWTILFASAVGLSCSYSKGRGKTVLETIILISVVAVVLTLHSLYSALRKRDFSLCELFLIGIFLVACVYIPIQVFHPFAKLSTSIFGCLVALAVAGRILLAGNLCINHNFYDPIGAAVIVHLIFLLNNPGRRELIGRR
ncbi:PREDICTED: BI1-like protein [Theobroma cacao]|uniref:BI1-like protein n=1 Tax=Theobroma cacao TaxID=3641 RepID=A0AB32UXJ7_THECC|nr:PREDICTED: BI1-like protein [Theobroma cacao]